MKGWVTWTAATLLVLNALAGFYFNWHDADAAIQQFSTALGLVGLGRKIEKKHDR